MNITQPVSVLKRDTVTSPQEVLLSKAARLSEKIAKQYAETCRSHGFPHREFEWLAKAGMLSVTLPGEPLDFRFPQTPSLLQLLKLLGKGNLSVGRIYEGHINALYLLHLFGDDSQQRQWYSDVAMASRLFGVWNTQARHGVRILSQADGSYLLEGTKTFCSGAGSLQRPIVPGTLIDVDGNELGWQMCVVPLEKLSREAIDSSFWQPLGMQSSVSYSVCFDGICIAEKDLLGAPEDYHLQPHFSGGAIRFAAVQLGGAEAIFDATRLFLRDLGRTEDPYQQMRLGEMAVLIESGNLWLQQSGKMADNNIFEEKMVNYANMVRSAIEEICIRVMQLAERCVGARGMLEPHPFGRLHADLSTYLRQPAPDAALSQAGGYVAQQKLPSHELWTIR